MDYQTHRRKNRSKQDPLKITYFKELENNNFEVNVLGSTRKPYQLVFSENGTTCECMDFQMRRNVCKHIFFIIGKISETNSVFNVVNNLEDITNDMLKVIKNNILEKIDIRKHQEFNNIQNIISIERDDVCSICTCIFDEQFNIKCQECQHVFHKHCLETWWDIDKTNQYLCAMCRTKSFTPDNETNDPWQNFILPKT